MRWSHLIKVENLSQSNVYTNDENICIFEIKSEIKTSSRWMLFSLVGKFVGMLMSQVRDGGKVLLLNVVEVIQVSFLRH